MKETDTETELIHSASEALLNAYAPYSSFRVGAALLTSDGRIYHGCNVENSAYGLSMCAERIAFFKAISEGQTEFKALALISETDEPIYPCGACRQVIAEFAPELDILMSTISRRRIIKKKLTSLLPHAFGPQDLRRKLD